MFLLVFDRLCTAMITQKPPDGHDCVARRLIYSCPIFWVLVWTA